MTARPRRYRPASCPLPRPQRAPMVAAILGAEVALGSAWREPWLAYLAQRRRLRRSAVAALADWLRSGPRGPLPEPRAFWLSYFDPGGEIRRDRADLAQWERGFRLDIPAVLPARELRAMGDIATRLLRRDAEARRHGIPVNRARQAQDLAALKATGADISVIERHLDR